MSDVGQETVGKGEGEVREDGGGEEVNTEGGQVDSVPAPATEETENKVSDSEPYIWEMFMCVGTARHTCIVLQFCFEIEDIADVIHVYTCTCTCMFMAPPVSECHNVYSWY